MCSPLPVRSVDRKNIEPCIVLNNPNTDQLYRQPASLHQEKNKKSIVAKHMFVGSSVCLYNQIVFETEVSNMVYQHFNLELPPSPYVFIKDL